MTSRSKAEGALVAALYRRVYRVVRGIPRGAVATYGQVAELAGLPRGGRVVGAAMRRSTPAMGLPWHRVVGKRSPRAAGISLRDPVGAAIQRKLLENEGIELSAAGTISLALYGWLPLDETALPRRPPRRPERGPRKRVRRPRGRRLSLRQSQAR